MNIEVVPKKLSGDIFLPESKSYIHRMIIAAALSDRETVIKCTDLCDDALVTVDCIRRLGGKAFYSDGQLVITPVEVGSSVPMLDFRSSATSARLIIPVAATMYDAFNCTGNSDLMKRPMIPFKKSFSECGTVISSDYLPFSVNGRIKSGSYSVDGKLSSQFVSGLLFALSCMPCKSVLTVTGGVSSRPYVDLTLDVLSKFGVTVNISSSCYEVHGVKQLTSPGLLQAEADMSLWAYYEFANLYGCNISAVNIPPVTLQGDGAFKTVAAGVFNGTLTNINVSDTPDLLPVLALTAAGTHERVCFSGTKRLRFKESDRVTSTVALINSLGGEAVAGDDTVTVNGNGGLNGGTVNSFGDHRIALAGAFASVITEKPVIINGIDCVSKSYPSFLDDFSYIGGEYREICV